MEFTFRLIASSFDSPQVIIPSSTQGGAAMMEPDDIESMQVCISQGGYVNWSYPSNGNPF